MDCTKQSKSIDIGPLPTNQGRSYLIIPTEGYGTFQHDGVSNVAIRSKCKTPKYTLQCSKKYKKSEIDSINRLKYIANHIYKILNTSQLFGDCFKNLLKRRHASEINFIFNVIIIQYCLITNFDKSPKCPTISIM